MADNKILIFFLIILIVSPTAFLVYYILQNREGESQVKSENENLNVTPRSIDPFLELYEKVEKVCMESGGTYKGCPHCIEGEWCECSPCDCPDGMFIDYAIGCRTLDNKE